MIHNALKAAFDGGYIRKLDRVVTAAGIPVNSPIMLNTIKVHFLGNILSRGHRAFGNRCSGRILKAESVEEVQREIGAYQDPILLVKTLERNYRPVISQLTGIIIEGSSEMSDDDIQKLNADIVVLAEASGAYEALEENLLVSLDGQEKIIYEGYVEF
jgi:pyruvate kinase